MELASLLKEREALQREIKVREEELRTEYNKLKLVHAQLELFITENHPNPRCRVCNARLEGHNFRHRFQPALNNLREIPK